MLKNHQLRYNMQQLSWIFSHSRMKIKQIDGRIERKQKSLSAAVGYVTMKVKMEKMHGLGYVATKRRNVDK